MKRILSFVLTVIFVTTLLTGCTTKNSRKQATSLVLGNHQNFPEINLNAQDIYNNIYNTSYSYGSVTVITVDGEPYLFADYKFNVPDKNIDNTKRKQIAKENTEQIINECKNAIAKTPEIDTLKAITMSANSLRLCMKL